MFSFFFSSLHCFLGSALRFLFLLFTCYIIVSFPFGYVFIFWDNGICAAPDFVCRYIAAPQPKHKERLDAVTGRYSVGRFPDSGRPCTLHLVLGPCLLLGLGFCICGYGFSGLVLATGKMLCSVCCVCGWQQTSFLSKPRHHCTLSFDMSIPHGIAPVSRKRERKKIIGFAAIVRHRAGLHCIGIPLHH